MESLFYVSKSSDAAAAPKAAVPGPAKWVVWTRHCCSAGFWRDPCGVFICCAWLEWGGCEEGSTSLSEAKPVPVNSLAVFNSAPWFLSCQWKDPGFGLLDKHPQTPSVTASVCQFLLAPFLLSSSPFPFWFSSKKQLSPNHFFFPVCPDFGMSDSVAQVIWPYTTLLIALPAHCVHTHAGLVGEGGKGFMCWWVNEALVPL